MPPKEQIFPAGKRTWRGQSSSHQQHRASSCDLGESTSSQSLDYSSKPRRPSVSKPGSSQGNARTVKLSVLQQGVLSSLDEAEERPTNRPTVPPSPRHSGTQSPRAAAGNSRPTVTTTSAYTFEDGKSGVTPRPVPPASVTGVGTFFPSPRTSHAKAEATTRPAERANSTSPGHPKKPAPANAVQHSMDVSQIALQSLLHKTGALQKIIASKIRKAERAGVRLIRKQNDFSAVANKAQDRALNLVDEREFQRPLTLLHQVSSFEDEAPVSPRSPRGKGLQNDLLLMRSAAEKKTFDVQMHRLVQHRWFIATMLKLRDYMKKMNNQVPMGCLKFVVVLQQVLLMGHIVTEAVFYADLEATVKAEDHVKSITHQLLRIVRRALDINDVAFLQYLEDREISPHPELVNQVKLLTKSPKKPTQTIAGLNAMRASFFRAGQSPGPSERATNVKVAFNVEVSTSNIQTAPRAMSPQLALDAPSCRPESPSRSIVISAPSSPSARQAPVSPPKTAMYFVALDSIVEVPVAPAPSVDVPTTSTVSAITADSALMTDSLTQLSAAHAGQLAAQES